MIPIWLKIIWTLLVCVIIFPAIWPLSVRTQPPISSRLFASHSKL